MKIAIIGGGWVGCHLAKNLSSDFKIKIFEGSGIFSQTSYRNQNRLHMGFHYARNSKTRNLCRDTFDIFMEDYGNLVEDVENNLYCVPKNKSLIDIETYKDIFRNFPHENFNSSKIKNIEGSIIVGEKYINFQKAREYFTEILKDITISEWIDSDKLKILSNEFDIVINSTNNYLSPIGDGYFYELTITLIYQKIDEVDFGALTFVDGDLFSIYPYSRDLYTLTDVIHTPIGIFSSPNEISKDIAHQIVGKKRTSIEERVMEFFPDFKKCFSYQDYFLSVKSKIISESSNRYPEIQKNGNIITCFTGKIQGIYKIEDYVKNEINNW